jgi:hypothetical protein
MPAHTGVASPFRFAVRAAARGDRADDEGERTEERDAHVRDASRKGTRHTTR